MKAPQPYIAPRTCTQAEAGKFKADAKLGPQSLKEHSDEGAYVLLAPPGSGKTSEFKRQARLCDGQFVSARDFITFEDEGEWHDRTLFIDGLDEVRAGSTDGRTSFDGIRKKLLQLGKPKFRLSCREADWFGSNDRRHLETVAPEGKVLVLRLDPLPEEEIKAILRKNHNEDDPDEFVDKARQRGVAALLENPLSLELLVKAVMKNEWPDSRIRTFEMACETLADEANEEHHYAKIRERANTTVLLNAAGQLCAVLLLAGAPGIQLSARSQDDNFIELNELTGTGRALQLESLKTRLFEAPNSEFVIPLHRHVAEFLGARYLAELVENGLPVNRILALMTGYDGMVVTELRGVCAWLATLCRTSREEIITRDPIGTVLYGDVAGFPPRDKERIIRELKKVSEKDHWFLGTIELDSRLGDVVSPELTNEILAILEDSARDGGRQSLTLFLIEALCHVHPLDGMSYALMKIIRDGSRWPSVRQKAIDAYLRQMEDRKQALADLKSLMREVYSSQVPDPHDELLGLLLEKTYPDALPGTEVLDYLRAPKSSQRIGYSAFWTWSLPERSSWRKKAGLLDRLAEQYTALEMEERQSGMRSDITTEVPFVLLDEVLSDSSVTVQVEPERLFGWLGVAGRLGDWDFGWGILHDRKQRVQSWLRQRPELWKILFKLGLERCKRTCGKFDVEFQQLMWMEQDRRLLDVRPPVDFASWCLEEAIKSDDLVAAQWLVQRVADQIEDGRISRELVTSRLQGNDFLRKALQKRFIEHESSRTRQNARKEMAEAKSDYSSWRNAVRDNRAQLIENRAPTGLLHNLATAYFGGYRGMTEYTPHERLRILLGGAEELVETALSGFRAAISRADLPTMEKVIALRTEGSMHPLSLPFLAGFNEWHESSARESEASFVPDGGQNRLAAALYYNLSLWPNPWGYGETERDPRWLDALVSNQPQLVADIFTKSISPRLRTSQNFSDKLYELAHSRKYKGIAELVAIPLLRSFPVRCTERQLPGLRFLLIAAERHCPKELFIEITKEKLKHTSMNVAQRVYWLAAGLVSSPQCFSGSLCEFVSGKKRRVGHLGTYIGGRFDQLPVQPDQADVSAIATLIQLLGAVYPPNFFNPELDSGTEDDDSVDWGTGISYRIDAFRHQLMENPSLKATQELEKLVRNEDLSVWRTRLELAISKQKEIRREADFQHVDVSTILEVFKNLQPANAADLAALTTDHINMIAQRIRGGNESGWKEYWILDHYDRPVEPKNENACRRTFLMKLQDKFAPLNVDARHEILCADDKRADIGVSFRRFNIPIEIKRSCHLNLWSAIRTQLIPRYTRDPDSDGHGIYLVFWFGNHEKCRPTPDAGPPPKSAEELKRRLEESLTDAERRKISVCVIDVEDRKNQGESDSNSHD